MGFTQNITKYLFSAFFVLLALTLSACTDSNNSKKSIDEPVVIANLAVTSTSPASDAEAVGANIIAVTATFSEAMNAETLDNASFTVGLTDDGMLMTGTVDLDTATNTAIFKPVGGGFAAGTTYMATITTAVKSADGKALATAYKWTFSIGTSSDSLAPTVTLSDPVEAATGVANNRNISASFSEAMYVPSINRSSFTVERNVPNAEPVPVAGTVKVIGNTAIFDPADDLAISTKYTATITTSVTDLANNPLAASFKWSFTTAANVAKGPAPVNLGTAGNFVVLAKSAISTTGTTKITGDIAVSPAALTFITGFVLAPDPSETYYTADGVVVGKIYAADMAVPTPSMLTTAISDMEIAYTDAAGRSNPDTTELGAGNISGRTLTPGLHKWSSGLLLASNVTLSGGANDVWIFQIAGDLTVSNGVMVTLEGGALPENVFWQVAGKTIFGTTSNVKGVFLSQTLIDLQTGAELNGRALSQTAVTLDANTVTQP